MPYILFGPFWETVRGEGRLNGKNLDLKLCFHISKVADLGAVALPKVEMKLACIQM